MQRVLGIEAPHSSEVDVFLAQKTILRDIGKIMVTIIYTGNINSYHYLFLLYP